jgi:hypothetical protein
MESKTGGTAMTQPQLTSPLAPPRGASIAVPRVLDVMLDPRAAFRDVGSRPTWGIALVALVLLRFGSVIAFYHPSTTPAKLAGGLLFQLVTILPQVVMTSTLLWIVAALWRTRISWASAACVTTHVMFAYTLVTVAVASVAGALLPASVDVDLRHPPFMNLSSLVGEAAPQWVLALAMEADMRSLYAIVLAVIGVRAASRADGWMVVGTVTTCSVIAIAQSFASTVR